MTMDVFHETEKMFEEFMQKVDDAILVESLDPLEMPIKFIDLVQSKEKELLDLKARIPDLEKKVQEVKEKNTQVEKARGEIQKELVKLTEEDELKTRQLKKIDKQIRDCNYNIKKNEEKLTPNLKDEKVLEAKRRELRAFQKLTGISWDFAVPDDILAGIVSNEKTNYLKTFEFDLKKTSQAQIQAALWSYIWESRGADWPVDCKKNVSRKANAN